MNTNDEGLPLLEVCPMCSGKGSVEISDLTRADNDT
jgi:hypothetical protein